MSTGTSDSVPWITFDLPDLPRLDFYEQRQLRDWIDGERERWSWLWSAETTLGSLGTRQFQGHQNALNQLAAADFQGLPWEVIPATREEISQLPAEEAEFGVFEASIGFREGQAATSFFINLPRYPRKWMSCSFLLEKRGAQWAVFEQSIEVLP